MFASKSKVSFHAVNEWEWKQVRLEFNSILEYGTDSIFLLKGFLSRNLTAAVYKVLALPILIVWRNLVKCQTYAHYFKTFKAAVGWVPQHVDSGNDDLFDKSVDCAVIKSPTPCYLVFNLSKYCHYRSYLRFLVVSQQLVNQVCWQLSISRPNRSLAQDQMRQLKVLNVSHVMFLSKKLPFRLKFGKQRRQLNK